MKSRRIASPKGTLSDKEIDRIAQYYFAAAALAEDEEMRRRRSIKHLKAQYFIVGHASVRGRQQNI
ncbi:MAG: hypothetical protein WAK55_23055, partial [Xanthobacteraceae bacterium]